MQQKIHTPNAFSSVGGIPAVVEMKRLDRTRCMSILHHLNVPLGGSGRKQKANDKERIGTNYYVVQSR